MLIYTPISLLINGLYQMKDGNTLIISSSLLRGKTLTLSIPVRNQRLSELQKTLKAGFSTYECQTDLVTLGLVRSIAVQLDIFFQRNTRRQLKSSTLTPMKVIKGGKQQSRRQKEQCLLFLRSWKRRKARQSPLLG